MADGPVRTVEIDEEIEALHVIGDDGVLFESADESLAGRGQALRLELGGAGQELAVTLRNLQNRLADLDSSSAELVAFVSIPFSTSNPVVAIVPEITVRQDGTGTAMITTVGNVEPPLNFDKQLPFDAPHEFTLRPERPPKEWCGAVDEAIRRMRNGQLDKVVLARKVIVDADAAFSQVSVLRQLRRTYPTSFRYAFEGFVGASPELLIERNDYDIRSEMLAGTAPRSSDPTADEALRTALLRSAKDRAEHRYLADMVSETLLRFTQRLEVPSTPSILSLANVHHLSTKVSGVLRADVSVLDLVAALHPTPAVGGRPTPSAIELIDELEEMNRGRYAGAIGWVDSKGNGRFAIAIRCAQLLGRTAHLYAGNGIIAASQSQRELEETQWKLQVMLSALIRP